MTDTSRTWKTAGRTLWRLAWPIAATGQLVFFLEAIILYWIGHLLGSDALATEATLRPIVQTAGLVLLASAGGVSALVAQSVGARNGEGRNLIASGMVLVAIAWVVLAAVLLPLSRPIAAALAPAGINAESLRWYGLAAVLLATPGVGLLQVLLFAATGAGWTRLSLIRMVFDLAMTAAIVPVFVHVLGLGLPGAPIGQAVSQFVMVVLLWRTLAHRADKWHLGGPPVRARVLDVKVWGHIIDVGLPPQIARIAMLVAYSYLVQRVALDGRLSVVGYGIALTLNGWGLNILGAVSRGTAIEIGQGIGGNDVGRAKLALRTGMAIALGVSVVLVIILDLLARPFVSLLVSNPTAIARGVDAMHVLTLSLPILAASQILLMTFTAIRAAKRAGMFGIVADVCGVLLALSWPGHSHLMTVLWAIFVSNALRLALFAMLARTLIPAAFNKVRAR